MSGFVPKILQYGIQLPHLPGGAVQCENVTLSRSIVAAVTLKAMSYGFVDASIVT